MRRGFIFLAGILLVGLMEVSGLAQDKLQGRWEGKAQTPQGEMPATVTFKKEGDNYKPNNLKLQPIYQRKQQQMILPLLFTLREQPVNRRV